MVTGSNVDHSRKLLERLAPFLDRVLAPEEGAKLLPILEEAMGSRRFHATGLEQHGDGSDGRMSVSHLEVDLFQSAWYVQTRNHLGEVLKERWHEDGVTVSPEFQGESPMDRLIPFPLRMVFLWRLPIWGRRCDDYVPLVIQANEEGNYLITLRRFSSSERHVHGGIELDAEHLLVSNYAVHDHYAMLLDVRPGRPITRGAEAKPFDLEAFILARQHMM